MESIKTGRCFCGADTINNFSLCINCNKDRIFDEAVAKARKDYEICVRCHKESIKTGRCFCGADTINNFSLCINCNKDRIFDEAVAKARKDYEKR